MLVFLFSFSDLDKPSISKANTTSGQTKLSCNATGHPKPTLHWVYKNETVSSTAEVILPTTDTQNALQLLNDYACAVNNSAAEYSSSFQGVIQCKWENIICFAFITHYPFKCRYIWKLEIDVLKNNGLT